MSVATGDGSIDASTDRLFCLPHAGGSAAVVSGWLARAVPELGVVSLEYPGHGRRMAEPFAGSVADLAADLLHTVREARGEVGFFGHSLGAVVAFELALALQATGGSNVVGLVVSGCSAPDAWTSPEGLELSDEALLSFVSAGGGGAELFEAEELRELFLPMLRADMEIAARYRGRTEGKADFPVLALCGENDPIAPRHAMDGWGNLTTDFAGTHAIEGSHFFPQERPHEVGTVVRRFFAGARTHDADV